MSCSERRHIWQRRCPLQRPGFDRREASHDQRIQNHSLSMRASQPSWHHSFRLVYIWVQLFRFPGLRLSSPILRALAPWCRPYLLRKVQEIIAHPQRYHTTLECYKGDLWKSIAIRCTSKRSGFQSLFFVHQYLVFPCRDVFQDMVSFLTVQKQYPLLYLIIE
ncbi:hypothetical protein JOM56_011849 [Amanita muscaria]